MKRSIRLTFRQYLIVLHDLLATAAAIFFTFIVRFEDYRLAAKLSGLLMLLPFFLVFAAVVYFVLGLQKSKWRFK
jgi:O-antigen biosynthesis protein WbqV